MPFVYRTKSRKFAKSSAQTVALSNCLLKMSHLSLLSQISLALRSVELGEITLEVIKALRMLPDDIGSYGI
jgi:hypothetical protein